MAEEPEPEVTDVLTDDEVVHVSDGVEELVESQEHPSTFLPEVPNWDEPERDNQVT